MDNPFNVNDDILRLNETLGYKFDFLDQQSDFHEDADYNHILANLELFPEDVLATYLKISDDQKPMQTLKTAINIFKAYYRQ